MPQQHGNNVALQIFPSGAASQAISGDLNSVTLNWSKNNPENTTFTGATTTLTTQRMSGQRDYSLDFAAIFNTGATKVESIMTTEMAASTYTYFLVAFGASVTGCPVYGGCAVLSDLKFTGPLNGPVAMTGTLQAGSGSLTRSAAA